MGSKRLRRTVNILSDGAFVGVHDGALFVQPEGGEKQFFPLGIIDGIRLSGNQSVSTEAMRLLCSEGKTLSIFTRKGRYICRVDGGVAGSVYLREQQWKMHFDDARRLAMAQQFVFAKIINSRRLVSDFSHNHKNVAFDDALLSFGQLLDASVGAGDLPTLLSIEGQAARIYWTCFGSMVLKDGWWDGTRSKRPPTDAANALLSYLYAIWTNDVAGCLASVGFDTQCGFLHELRAGRASLACDVIEEFRAGIIDRFALRCINRKQITLDDFRREGIRWLLTDDGKRKLFPLMDAYRCEIVRHRGINEDVQIGELPLLQARLLARHVRGEDSEYRAYVTRG